MNSPAEYAAVIIDITAALLEHKHGLNRQQVEQVEIMNRRAIGFVTDYLQNQSYTLEHFRSYLNHDAMSPLTIIVGYSEMLLLGASGDLTGVYLEAVEEIRNYAYAIMDELRDIYQSVLELLKNPAFA